MFTERRYEPDGYFRGRQLWFRCNNEGGDYFMLISRIKNTMRGDTIVEVMVSVVVLGLVLGTAYSLSNKSLKTGTQANQRSQALSVASSQIERLKAQFVELGSS